MRFLQSEINRWEYIRGSKLYGELFVQIQKQAFQRVYISIAHGTLAQLGDPIYEQVFRKLDNS